MNALCYKIVFSKRLGALVAVGEHTSGQGKAAGTGVRTAVYPNSAVGATAGEFVGSLKAVFASVALTCFTATTIAAGPAANTLPTGYSVNSGNVAVSTSGADMTIKQTTDKASVNWQSFSIGSAASVNIQQNSASSVLLNRVVGNDPSQIFGKLTANGQVILINPNGIVFGKGGSVTASAFTASTFGMTEDDFNKGKRKFSRNGSTASVTVEEGASINTTTPGGYIALIASTVNNQGSISAKQGSVVLAAAETVTLPSALTDNVGIPLSSKVRLELAPSTIKASVENGGTITTEGGQVLMRAAAVADAVASVTHTGTIDTTGEQGGGVDVLADGGQIRVSGSIKANSNNGTAGGDIYIGRDKDTNVLAAVSDASGARIESKGGFVETSGKFLNVDGSRVMAKDWLLDPDNIDITGDASEATTGYSKVKASDIVANLNIGTSVTIATSPTAGTSVNQPGYKDTLGTGAGTRVEGDGNILVNAVISKTSGSEASLTLLADNGITVNQEIKSTSNKLNVTMKANGSASGASSQGLVINKSIDANGGAINLEGKNTISAATVTTASRAAVTVASTAFIQGASVTMVGNSTSGAAIKGTGKVNATAGGVSITGVGNTTGDYALTTNSTIDATGDILISTTSAALHGIAIREKVTSSGGKVDLYADVLTSGGGSAINGNFAIKAKNDVTITGKSNGYYSVNGLGAIESTDGKVTIDATSTASSALRLTNTVTAKGNVLIKGTAHNDSGINTGSTTTVTSTDGDIEFIGKTTGLGVGVNLSGTTNINATKGTFKVTAESAIAQGMVFQGNTTINAATYTINAESKGGAAGLYQGSGPTTFTSSSGNSSIKGTSASGRGVFVQNGTLNFNANSGSTATFSSGKGEMRLGYGGGPTVNTTGNVTLGSDQSGFFSQADTNVNSGTLTIRGKSAGHGVAIQDGSLQSTDIMVKNGSSLVIVGESTGSGSGIHLLPQGIANKINMTTDGAATKGTIIMEGVSAFGVGISTGSTPITSDGGEIRLKGTGNGANGTGMNLNGLVQSVNGATGGKITIDANTVSLTGGPALLDAGSNGTVNIKTHNNNDILVGAADVRSATPANQKLGIDQAELSLIKAGNLVIGDTASAGKITVLGATATAATTGHITLETKGDINVKNTLSAANGKNLTLKAIGDINVDSTISQSSTGNIVLAAGLDGFAGVGTGGQVRRTTGVGAVDNDLGKTFIYTGTVTGSAQMGLLNNSLAQLNLSAIGSNPQNAKSNTATILTNPITGLANTISNGASMQVMYREKIAVNLTDNTGSVTLNNATKNYGDVAKPTVDSDAKTAIKAVNAIDKTLSWTQSGNNFKLSSHALLDTLSIANVTNGSYSTAEKLKASETAYGTTSLTYSMTSSQALPTLKVDQRSLTASYAANNKVFDGDTSALVTATLKDILGADKVSAAHTGATFNSADVGTGKTVTVSGISLVGDDASNYKLPSAIINAGNKATTTASITARPPTPHTPVVPSNNAGARVKVPVGSANPFALASAEDLADETCSANSVENCYCEESAVSQGVDICYEPKTAAKGSVR